MTQAKHEQSMEMNELIRIMVTLTVLFYSPSLWNE